MILVPNTLIQQRYRIEQKIGQGGMGAIYQATDIRFGSTVALKQYSIQANLTPDQQQCTQKAFEREARILHTLRHEGLPRVTDYFAEHGQLFLVMDFIPGQDLETILRQRNAPCPTMEVLSWAYQLCDILAYLHGQHPPSSIAISNPPI